jgi:hypothetical protein
MPRANQVGQKSAKICRALNYVRIGIVSFVNKKCNFCRLFKNECFCCTFSLYKHKIAGDHVVFKNPPPLLATKEKQKGEDFIYPPQVQLNHFT